MADPVPTFDQAMAAVMSALTSSTLSATVLPFENRLKSELELLRAHQDPDDPTAEVELVLVDADPDSVEGRTHGEVYTIYKFQLRHLYTTQDEEMISRIAKFRAEKIRTLLEGNSNVFRIGGQVPLRTPETVTSTGGFVEREESRYYETILRFEVEARRWA
jgi:hypothetical protein